MSGFVVLERDPNMGVAEVERRLRAATMAFARKGMTPSYSGNHGTSVVSLFANETHDPALAMSKDRNGQFCTYVGTLIYRGLTGSQATAAILVDASRGRSGFINDALGNFCLLLGDECSLRIYTDSAGLHHVYHSDDLSLVTNSFIAAACAGRSSKLGRQEILEYIVLAAVFGRQTLLKDCKLLPARGELLLAPSGRRISLREDPWASDVIPTKELSIEGQLAKTIADLDNYFSQVAAIFDQKITAALSGGYDSRLVLALLLRHGISPRSFVYGESHDADVRIAEEICRGEGIVLHHVRRGDVGTLGPDEYWRNQDLVFHGLDGLTQYGFACEPYEISHRHDRVYGGLLAINGGGGEIWRDFWKLPDRRMTPRQFVGAVYGGRLAGLYGSGKHPREFMDQLSLKVAETVGIGSATQMSPAVIQSLYARFRVRFWQGKNNSVDNHIGYALTPFAENSFAVPAMWIPVAAKRDGWFERQLILRVAPRLAAYNSSYGFDFLRGPGLTTRMAIKGKYWTPLWFRRLHRRISEPSRRFRFHSAEFVKHQFGEGRLEVEQYVQLDRLRDPLAFSRALAVERMLRGHWI